MDFDRDSLVVNAAVVYLREVLLHLGPRSPLSHEFIRYIFRVHIFPLSGDGESSSASSLFFATGSWIQ